MLASVLALQEKDENLVNILDSLPDCETEIVCTVHDALAALDRKTFHLIISAVHLEHDGSVFDFLKSVRDNQFTKHTPFVFYCSRTTSFARSVRHGLQIAARTLGADRYITMEYYDRAHLRAEFIKALSLNPELSDHQTALISEKVLLEGLPI